MQNKSNTEKKTERGPKNKNKTNATHSKITATSKAT
jgi:hypothetical protein